MTSSDWSYSGSERYPKIKMQLWVRVVKHANYGINVWVECLIGMFGSFFSPFLFFRNRRRTRSLMK